jgi:hypothetical protein
MIEEWRYEGQAATVLARAIFLARLTEALRRAEEENLPPIPAIEEVARQYAAGALSMASFIYLAHAKAVLHKDDPDRGP